MIDKGRKTVSVLLALTMLLALMLPLCVFAEGYSVRIRIDLNDDGDFRDSGEQYEVTAPGTVALPATPVRDAKGFTAGWTTGDDTSVVTNTDSLELTEADNGSVVTLRPAKAPIYYTITFVKEDAVYDSGSGFSEADIIGTAQYCIADGELTDLPEAPEKKGYVLDFWNVYVTFPLEDGTPNGWNVNDKLTRVTGRVGDIAVKPFYKVDAAGTACPLCGEHHNLNNIWESILSMLHLFIYRLKSLLNFLG